MSESLIPTMTSNTTPSGIASASSVFSTETEPFNAFDKNNSTRWIATANIKTGWLSYGFSDNTAVDTYSLYSDLATQAPKDWTFEGSNDGTTWTILDTRVNETVWTSVNYYTLSSVVSYKFYRINVTANNGGSNLRVSEFELYNSTLSKILLLQENGTYTFNRVKKNINLIPKMTSNITPSGVVSASSTASTVGFEAWKAFDKDITTSGNAWVSSQGNTIGWLQYDFGSNSRVIVNRYSIIGQVNPTSDTSKRSPKNWTFEGSNDGTTWTVLDSRINTTWIHGEVKEFNFSNNNPYRFYRLNITANNGDVGFLAIGELSFYKDSLLTAIPSHSEQNFIKYGMDSPVQVDGIFTDKNYILQDTVSENAEGLWVTQINRKPLSIKFN